jgi:hypothetical protein
VCDVVVVSPPSISIVLPCLATCGMVSARYGFFMRLVMFASHLIDALPRCSCSSP